MDAKTIAGAGMIIGGGLLGFRSMKELSSLGCYGPAGYLTLGLAAIGGGLYLFGRLQGEAVGEATESIREDVAAVLGSEEAGLPVIDNSFGDNSAGESGHGVPQWVGSAEARTRMTTKDGTRKYVRRNSKGQFTSYQVNVDGKKGAAAIDRRMKARSYAPAGFRDRGDANAQSRFERGAETAMEPVIPNSFGESSAPESGHGVPQWYGSAEGRGNPRRMMMDRWGNRRFVRRRKDGTIMKNVAVDGSKGSLAIDRRMHAKNYAPAGFRDQGDRFPQSMMERGAETAGLPVIPNSFGDNSAPVDGHGVPQWYGSAEGRGNPRRIMTDRWGNRRFVRRRKDGTIMKNVAVDGKKGSLAIDRRMKARSYAPAGFRDQGDKNLQSRMER